MAMFGSYESEFALENAFSYYIPIFVFAAIGSIYIIKYGLRESMKWEEFIDYLSNGIYFIFFTLLFYGFLTGALSSYFLVINSYGKQELVAVSSPVINCRDIPKSPLYEIGIMIPNEKRELELTVRRSYHIGEIYQAKMFKGNLGFYYTKK